MINDMAALASAWEEQARHRYKVTPQLSDTARGLVAAEAETLLSCAAQLRELFLFRTWGP